MRETTATGLDSSAQTMAIPAGDGSLIVQAVNPTNVARISVVRPIKLVEKAEPLNHGATNEKLWPIDTTDGNASAAYESPVDEIVEER